MKFRDVIRILEDADFSLKRRRGTSHRIYNGFVDGQRRLVVIAAHSLNDDVKPGTLASIIRQSGLPKSRFR